MLIQRNKQNILSAALLTIGIAMGAAGTAVLSSTPNPADLYLIPGDQIIIHAIPAPSPSGQPSPSVSIPPSASPPVVPSASPTNPPVPTACGSSAQAVLDATPSGGTVDFGSCIYNGATLAFNKPITALRGIFKFTTFNTVSIRSNDVTIDGATFEGGGDTIKIYGVDRTKILNSTFTGMSSTSIRLLAVGTDDTLIQGNTITQSLVNGTGYSPIAANDGGAGVGTFKNLTVRNNTIDQGGTNVGWFGVEVWGVAGLLIEGNTFRGRGPQISIPRSDGAIVQKNAFDLSKTFWVIELADIDNVQVLDNVATGVASGSSQFKAFLQINKGSGTANNFKVTGNKLTNYDAFVNAGGQGHVITDNCLINVGRFNWDSWAGPVTIARNGPC